MDKMSTLAVEPNSAVIIDLKKYLLIQVLYSGSCSGLNERNNQEKVFIRTQ